ncbi:binding-protein-dependent transport systems inner membrane component [Caldicellulosiruptor kronotskyensis 2002]|uniref:Binding-protein-dependent transport systems inner membrane component n=1 Tax=Caldicellulosiruptor kronotskyensis (strain DSM 18902 / VKM B-2412 / 2002) TaxID=632348 RepID=E4SCH1_CALK2|nr:carbohydrate ABC transporter permease [Caldicellulosiruptor kronotskyensis]ADQ45026.1 binding-protein-dependent transport systems inner membrane component [Caldicellulosiruptor kronotskyensis 2002]
MSKQSSIAKRDKTILLILLGVFSIGQLFPLVWLVDFSLCKSGDVYGANILKIPSPPQYINYIVAWRDGKIPQYFINSVIVNFVSVFLVVLFSLMMGYAFVRMNWKWSNRVLTYVLLGLMIPIHATLLPNFVIFRQLNILDSYFALIIPYVAFSLPQAVFLMTGFIGSIPRALEESAIIDGCGIFRILFQIILPLSKPALVTVTVTTFLNTWNEFIMAATYLTSDRFRTLPFSVYNFAGQYASNYAVQFAVMTIVALPSLIVYIALNEQVTKGVTLGAVKG